MKIVILDGHTTNPGDLSWDFLKEFGEFTVYDRTPVDKIIERALGYDIIITNKTPISADVMAQLPDLKFIALLSTGFNVIDIDFAKQRGIPVSNVPSYSTAAVAQLVFAFLLEHSNKVSVHNEAVKNGEWSNCQHFCFWKTPLSELQGKTIGIIGYGQIGREVAKIAEAFGMNILAHSRSSTPNTTEGKTKFVELDELLKNSDFVSLHCPLTPQTEKMVNKDFIAKMKPSAFLVNTSRGPVVDEDALAEALKNGKLAGAGVDVLSTEPPAADNPLLSCDNCLITPHVAWAGLETRKRLIEILKGNIKAFIDGNPRNVVNK
ncbi:MAG: D-2-hydroxyacid dehydrogenase [Clostridia bacterium]|nr:D-2-hydroxyacid dehydrogenase [Clostridia bacterium]